MEVQHLEQLTKSDPAGPSPIHTSPSVLPAAALGETSRCPSIENFSAIALPGVVSIGAIDLKAEYVTICNDSSTEVSLDGWSLYSARGKQQHLFPSDILLQSGEKLVVWSGPRSDGGRDVAAVQHLVWSGRNLWNGVSLSAVESSCCCCYNNLL